ncbi:MAG: hypothetical protein G01um101418_382 [Parcubacteria group bacterium Gr01-1014_18]|nr:MAG: hypothetical protein Greene041636_372 [Parcubacteria group bacterium Greene0416_36]TSC81103.1 MAG: hypothetical protein G01um101418_382 [Parcubacteria group bacterium Gr01-1014_18]TSC98481.1 MAG: hypothetical protein Greene101420_718 [Parcubacteria group bacterium Greene1014_20]TSD07354.1 MAG: hypothetical protein Greene07142_209 [Parcubacteria group bacterium Greene0714_2]
MKELFTQLKSLKSKTAPREEWKKETRKSLLSLRPTSEASGSRWAVLGSARVLLGDGVLVLNLGKSALMVALVCVAFWESGSATVNVAKNSLPGDNLYSLKRALEDTKLRLASQDDLLRLKVSLVEERLREASTIEDHSKIRPVLEEIKKGVDSIGIQIAGIKKGDTETVALVNQKAEELGKGLNEIKGKLGEDFVVQAAITSVEQVSIQLSQLKEKNDQEEEQSKKEEAVVEEVK